MLGRLTCKVQQIDLIEEWRLEEIAGDYAQRQVQLLHCCSHTKSVTNHCVPLL